MSDDLVIRGGGSTAVAVDTLFADANRLATAEAIVQGWVDRYASIHAHLEEARRAASLSGWLPWPEHELCHAGAALSDVADRIASVRRALLESAERYGETERFATALWDLGATLGTTALGFVAPQLLAGTLIAMLPTALTVAAGYGVARAAGADPDAVVTGSVREWVQEHRGVINDPGFVRFVRTFADHADDFLLGALRVPAALPLAFAVDAPESASMILGTAGVAAAGLGSGRVLVDGPVRVERVAPRGPARDPAVAPPRENAAAVPAPDGWEDLIARVPPSDGGAQIALERHVVDGENRWLVYIGGTVDFGLDAGAEPFDMTSNVHGIADDSPLDAMRLAGASSAGAERAVREALAAAGAAPGDAIMAIGHSGGGVIAASLAGDPGLNVVDGLNLGGPIASAQIPPDRAFTSVEHDDDPVPATGGSGHASHVQVISRRVNEHGYDGDDLLPAHRLVEHRRTGSLMDESDDPRLIAGRERMREFTGGTVGERSEWRAVRE